MTNRKIIISNRTHLIDEVHIHTLEELNAHIEAGELFDGDWSVVKYENFPDLGGEPSLLELTKAFELLENDIEAIENAKENMDYSEVTTLDIIAYLVKSFDFTIEQIRDGEIIICPLWHYKDRLYDLWYECVTVPDELRYYINDEAVVRDLLLEARYDYLCSEENIIIGRI